MAGKEIFSLFGSIFINDGDTSKKLNDIDKKGMSVGQTFSKMGGMIATAGAAIVAGAAAAGTAIFTMVNKTAAAADEIDKLSSRVGIGVENLQKWKYAAGQSGADIGVLETGIKKLSNSMDDAMNGNEKAIESFDKLGISVDDLKTKTQEEIFEKVMAGLADTEKGAQRNALGNDLLGKSYTELLPLLNEGSDGMTALKNRAEELGIVMSEDTVKAGVQFGDTLDDIKQVFGAVIMQIGAQFLPMMQSMLDWVLKHMPEIKTTATAAMTAIGDGLNLVIGWVQSLISWGQNWVSENQTQISSIKAEFDELFSALNYAISSFTSWAQEFWQAHGDKIIAVVEFMWSLIKISFETSFAVIKDLLNIFGALFSGDWEKLWESVKQYYEHIWNGMKEFYSTILEGLKQASEVAFEAIKQTIISKWTQSKQETEALLSSMTSFIKGKWEQSRQDTITLWTEISGFVVSKFQWLYDHNYLFQQLVDFINTKWTEASTKATEIWNAISTFISGIWTSIKTTAETKATELVTAVSTKWTEIKTAAETKFNEIYSWLSGWWEGLKTDMYNWASNAISMFAQGLREGIGAIASAAGDIASTIASFLGFHSPPAEGPASDSDTWGPNFVGMLADGITANQGLVATAASGLAGVLTTTMDGAMAYVQKIADDVTEIAQGIFSAYDNIASTGGGGAGTINSSNDGDDWFNGNPAIIDENGSGHYYNPETGQTVILNPTADSKRKTSNGNTVVYGGNRKGIEVTYEPGITRYAEGTDNARRGWAWVGEYEPELVNFRGGESVTPLSKMNNAGGFKTANIIIELDGQTIVRAIGEPLRDMIIAKTGLSF